MNSTHKYISKKMGTGGKWEYVYAEGATPRQKKQDEDSTERPKKDTPKKELKAMVAGEEFTVALAPVAPGVGLSVTTKLKGEDAKYHLEAKILDGTLKDMPVVKQDLKAINAIAADIFGTVSERIWKKSAGEATKKETEQAKVAVYDFMSHFDFNYKVMRYKLKSVHKPKEKGQAKPKATTEKARVDEKYAKSYTQRHITGTDKDKSNIVSIKGIEITPIRITKQYGSKKKNVYEFKGLMTAAGHSLSVHGTSGSMYTKSSAEMGKILSWLEHTMGDLDWSADLTKLSDSARGKYSDALDKFEGGIDTDYSYKHKRKYMKLNKPALAVMEN